jgi:type II secretion system protein I
MRMRARPGFTLLEAVVALTIVSITAISALAAVGAELRTAERARRALAAEALAKYRLATVELLSSKDAARLPDSLAKGTFAAPFAEYRWTASAAPRRNTPAMYDVTVRVAWDGGEYALDERLYRPLPAASP